MCLFLIEIVMQTESRAVAANPFEKSRQKHDEFKPSVGHLVRLSKRKLVWGLIGAIHENKKQKTTNHIDY